jgi:hypothetical protein
MIRRGGLLGGLSLGRLEAVLQHPVRAGSLGDPRPHPVGLFALVDLDRGERVAEHHGLALAGR